MHLFRHSPQLSLRITTDRPELPRRLLGLAPKHHDLLVVVCEAVGRKEPTFMPFQLDKSKTVEVLVVPTGNALRMTICLCLLSKSIKM
jgi:hypothetical protein